jgi:hypothetical protein
MRFASYVATSVAIILIILVSNSSSIQSFSNVNKTLLSIPLILSFFMLVGIRIIVNIPIAVEANWILKLTENLDKRNYFLGLKKAIFSFVLFPLFFLLFLFYSYLWGWQLAFYHCLYGITISILLVEVLFFNYHKIPFACSYLPGKAKLHYFWIIYLISFLIYVFLMSTIEYTILNYSLNLFIFCGFVFIIIIVLRIIQNHIIYKRLEFMYEERTDPIMVTLIPYE